MGADMLLWYVPAIEDTPQNRQVMSDVIENLTEDQLAAYREDRGIDDDAEAIKGRLTDALAEMFVPHRDAATLYDPDWPYGIFVSGGMSGGDNPTDSSETIEDLSYCRPVYAALRSIAIRETAAARTPLRGREESRSNARLIAAAPDLREACEAVLDAIAHADLHGEVIWIRPPWQDSGVHETASERLEAALAKVGTKD